MIHMGVENKRYILDSKQSERSCDFTMTFIIFIISSVNNYLIGPEDSIQSLHGYPSLLLQKI